MAAAMEHRAGACASPHHSAEFRSIANSWRDLADRAAWQDALA